MQTCAIYARVSDESQVKGESIPHQISFAKTYARRRGLESGEPWYTPDKWVFVDEGISGTSMVKRNAVLRLIHAARNRCFDIVLFKGISRFARDTVDALVMLRTLLACDVRVISLEENFDSERDNAEFVFTIHSALAQAESEKIAVRVRMGAMEKAKLGQWNGRPPDGYRLNPFTKKLEIDGVFAPIIEEIFRLYQSGYGCRKIAEMLNDRQLFTRLGNEWTARNISRVLRNPAYVGDVVYGRRVKRMAVPENSFETIRRVTAMSDNDDDVVVRENAHRGIIDRETFIATQQKLENRSQNPGRDGSLRLLTRGLLRCLCGGPMVVKTNGNQESYYQCGRQGTQMDCDCAVPNIRADTLENTVLAQIRKDLDRILDFSNTMIRSRTVDPSHLARIQQEREQQFKRLSQLFEKYAVGQFGESQLEHMSQFIQTRLAFLDSVEQRLNCQTENRSVASNTDVETYIKERALLHLTDVHRNSLLSRELLHLLVHQIEMIRSTANTVCLKVRYRFQNVIQDHDDSV